MNNLKSPITRILTHAGKAHRDEFLALCLLLALHSDERGNCAITRIDRTADDRITEDLFRDPSVAIIDVGRRLEPDLSNFDHHQLDMRNQENFRQSSFVQVLVHFAKAQSWDEPLEDCLPWMEYLAIHDNFGPQGVGKHLRISWEHQSMMESPVEMAMIRAFGAELYIDRTMDRMWSLMTETGRWIINRLNLWQQDMERMARAPQFTLGSEYQIVDLRDVVGKGPTFKTWCARHPNVQAVILINSKGPGYVVERINDHGYRTKTEPKLIDFQRLRKNDPLKLVQFVHASGHLAVVSDEPVEMIRTAFNAAPIPA